MRRGTGNIVIISALTTIVGTIVIKKLSVNVPGFTR